VSRTAERVENKCDYDAQTLRTTPLIPSGPQAPPDGGKKTAVFPLVPER
jgi:hypothetical protein